MDMKWAKARSCEEYDLWGVPDEEEDGTLLFDDNTHAAPHHVEHLTAAQGPALTRVGAIMDR